MDCVRGDRPRKQIFPEGLAQIKAVDREGQTWLSVTMHDTSGIGFKSYSSLSTHLVTTPHSSHVALGLLSGLAEPKLGCPFRTSAHTSAACR